jgi:hypothetical protein
VEQGESKRLAAYCRKVLPLKSFQPGEDSYYRHLPLCVIDTVFSIGSRYAATRNTVRRFCTRFALEPTNPRHPEPAPDQLSIADFLAIYADYGVQRMAEEVYQNRQRTSSRNGILKAEAALHFAQAIAAFDVNRFEDVARIFENEAFEARIRQIPGQRSGVSLRYFYMLLGSQNHVKPDRMILRFLQAALGRTPNIQEAHDLVVVASMILRADIPYLTPAALDHLIWAYQREVKP